MANASLATKHEQLRLLILNEIAALGLATGDRIPSRPFWRRQLGASNDTVDRALRDLITEGVLTARAGSGTFLNRPLAPRVLPAAAGKRPWVLDVLVPRERERLVQGSSPHVLLQRLEGVSRGCAERGIATALHFLDPHRYQTPRELLEAIGPLHAGAIFLQDDLVARLEETWRKRGLPYVAVTGTDRALNAVASNLVPGYEQLMAHLAALGRKNIACLSNDPASAKCHLGVLRAAAAKAGLELAHVYWSELDPRPVLERLAGRDIRERGIDALVCRSDRWALQALDALRAAGLRVPEDLVVTGCDDIAEAAQADPPLATLALPFEACGKAAVEQLAAQLDGGPREFPSVYLATHFIPRRSALPAGAAPGSGTGKGGGHAE